MGTGTENQEENKTEEVGIPKYGKNLFVTTVTDNLFKILGVAATFSSDFELLYWINGLQRALRQAMAKNK